MPRPAAWPRGQRTPPLLRFVTHFIGYKAFHFIDYFIYRPYIISLPIYYDIFALYSYFSQLATQFHVTARRRRRRFTAEPPSSWADTYILMWPLSDIGSAYRLQPSDNMRYYTISLSYLAFWLFHIHIGVVRFHGYKLVVLLIQFMRKHHRLKKFYLHGRVIGSAIFGMSAIGDISIMILLSLEIHAGHLTGEISCDVDDYYISRWWSITTFLTYKGDTSQYRYISKGHTLINIILVTEERLNNTLNWHVTHVL